MTRVLIVDDETSYRDHLQRYLARDGYGAGTTASEPEAPRIGEELRPDVLLADWMLKDPMHGLRVAESLRREDREHRVMRMTGLPSSEIRDEASRAGVLQFMEKPFGLEKVAAAIREAAADRARED